MPEMREVKFGFNKYCGPAVLSIVTGRSTDECASAISQVTGNYKVEGVYFKDLKAAAKKLRFDLQETPYVGNSLYSAIMSIVQINGVFIVQLKGHYVCLEIKDKQVWFCDNHTKEPMPAASSARLMNGVIGIHKVVQMPKPDILPERITEVIHYKCEYCEAISPDRDEMFHYRNCAYKESLELNK